MSGIFILAIITWVIISAVKRDKAAEKAKKRRVNDADAVPATVENGNVIKAAVPGDNAWTCSCGYKNTAEGKFCRQCGKARGASGSLAYKSSEGVSTEGSTVKARVTAETPKTTLKHIVKPITESPHGHTETSIYGADDECEELYVEADDAYAEVKYNSGITVELHDREKLVQSIVLSEILAKPKSFRR